MQTNRDLLPASVTEMVQKVRSSSQAVQSTIRAANGTSHQIARAVAKVLDKERADGHL